MTISFCSMEELEEDSQVKRGENMIHFHDNKTKRIIAAVIVILVVIAMVVPMFLEFLI